LTEEYLKHRNSILYNCFCKAVLNKETRDLCDEDRTTSVRENWTFQNTAVQWSFTEHFGSPSPGQGDTALRFFPEV